MTAKDLLKKQLDDVGHQLKQTLDGLTEQQWDHRACSCARTPRETVEHLCEAYEAFVKSTKGEKHDWGSYSIDDRSSENLKRVFEETRSRAAAAAIAAEDDAAIGHASEYLVVHDAYHVGQLCSSRIETDPNWNPYVIYAGHG